MRQASDYAHQVYSMARLIPRGRVISYGALGSLLTPPLSGRMVGRLMRHCSDDVPWWRVVAKSGGFPIYKIDPGAANEQVTLLSGEGVEVREGQVNMKRFEMGADEMAALS